MHHEPTPPPRAPLDTQELERAGHSLRTASARFDRIAREEGWSVLLAPLRALILARLQQATTYGLSARRLARLFGLAPSTLAYHLDALEGAGLLSRAAWTVHDRRKVAVRLTPTGRYAVWRLLAQLPSPPMRSPAIASP